MVHSLPRHSLFMLLQVYSDRVSSPFALRLESRSNSELFISLCITDVWKCNGKIYWFTWIWPDSSLIVLLFSLLCVNGIDDKLESIDLRHTFEIWVKNYTEFPDPVTRFEALAIMVTSHLKSIIQIYIGIIRVNYSNEISTRMAFLMVRSQKRQPPKVKIQTFSSWSPTQTTLTLG